MTEDTAEDYEGELKRICHHMAYGDDSDETFDRYLKLVGLNLTKEERDDLKEDIFY